MNPLFKSIVRIFSGVGVVVGLLLVVILFVFPCDKGVGECGEGSAMIVVPLIGLALVLGGIWAIRKTSK